MTTRFPPKADIKSAGNFKNGTYHCPELRRNPGIPAERFAAFELPSRFGNELRYPDGRSVWLGSSDAR